MKKLVILLVSILFVQNVLAKDSYKADVSIQKAYEMQQKGAVLIDVRTKEEFNQSHPKGAINIEVFFNKDGSFAFNKNFIEDVQKALNNDKKKEIIVICRSGVRSVTASDLLAKNGFENVNNIVKGVKNGWEKENLPIE